MIFELSPDAIFSLMLYIISFHSLCVGAALMARPQKLMRRAGFASVNEPFFPVQGGMFHIIMAVGYALAGADLKFFAGLIIFSIIVKMLAMIFLIGYYLMFESKKIIFVSGVVDGVMGIFILYGYMYL